MECSKCGLYVYRECKCDQEDMCERMQKLENRMEYLENNYLSKEDKSKNDKTI